mmetsp:Transcript_18111/g.37155  ORF Transcript_18111/g.37155 Transcript_18111/m.37155 type:complete len:112 (+) Transcript_18111:738-1073(+)
MVVSRISSTAKDGVDTRVQHSQPPPTTGKPGFESERAANHKGLLEEDFAVKASKGSRFPKGVFKVIMHEKSGMRSLGGSREAKPVGIPALARCQPSEEELMSVNTTASNPR